MIDSIYTAKAKDIIGYALEGDATRTIDPVTKNQTITFMYVPSNSKITVRYVKDTETGYKDIDKPLTATVGNGDSFTATAIDVAGYTLSQDPTWHLDKVTQDETILFVYKPTQVKTTITINYVDQDGHEIPGQGSTTVTATVGNEKRIKYPSIGGYYKPESSDWYDIDSVTLNQIVNLKYLSNNVTVTTSYVDEDGKELPGREPTIEIAPRGKDYTVNYKYTMGYELIGEETQTIPKIDGDKEIKFKYRLLKPATITIEYISDNPNNRVLGGGSDHRYPNIGDAFTADIPVFDGYTYDSTSVNTIDKVTGDAILTLNYIAKKYKITTKYQTKDGDTVKDIDGNPIVDTVMIDSIYTAKAKDIIGYALEGDATRTIDPVTKNQTITFMYVPSNSKITVRYVKDTETGYKDIDKPLTATVGNGDSFTATAIDVAGYTLSQDPTWHLDKVTQDETILFVYKPTQVKTTITINYVDQDGHEISGHDSTTVTANVGEKKGIEYPSIGGYFKPKGSESWYYIDSVTKDQVVNLEYLSNNVTVTTYYVDEEDGKELPRREPTIELAPRGQDYTVNYKYTMGYELIGEETQTIPKIDGDKKIIFRYKKN